MTQENKVLVAKEYKVGDPRGSRAADFIYLGERSLARLTHPLTMTDPVGAAKKYPAGMQAKDLPSEDHANFREMLNVMGMADANMLVWLAMEDEIRSQILREAPAQVDPELVESIQPENLEKLDLSPEVLGVEKVERPTSLATRFVLAATTQDFGRPDFTPMFYWYGQGQYGRTSEGAKVFDGNTRVGDEIDAFTSALKDREIAIGVAIRAVTYEEPIPEWFTIRIQGTTGGEHYCEMTLQGYVKDAEVFDDYDAARAVAEELRDAHWYPGSTLMNVDQAVLFKLQALGFRPEQVDEGFLRVQMHDRAQIQVVKWKAGYYGEPDIAEVVWSDAYKWDWKRDEELTVQRDEQEDDPNRIIGNLRIGGNRDGEVDEG